MQKAEIRELQQLAKVLSTGNINLHTKESPPVQRGKYGLPDRAKGELLRLKRRMVEG